VFTYYEQEDIVASSIADGQRRRSHVAGNSAIGRDVIIDGDGYLVPAVASHLVVRTDRCPAELDGDDGSSL